MKPKVLIISRDSWNTTNNTGNTLSNLFQNWDATSIANIYCRDEIPNNSICNKYFKISESILIKRLFRRNEFAGMIHSNMLTNTDNENHKQSEIKEANIYNFFRRKRLYIFLWLREFIWTIVDWKSKELETFIKTFEPDIIFSPSFDSFYMHKILYYVQKVSGKKVVMFHSDDLVTFKQSSASPFFWINRLLLRRYMNRSIGLAVKNYCIINGQAKVYESIYKRKFDILYKVGDFENLPPKKELGKPLTLVYTGNIIYGRLNSLVCLANALKVINSNEILVKLEIYTANPIPDKIIKILQENNAITLKGKVSYDEIPKILLNSDILVHVESLKKKQMLATRLSFSTKIVDYLQAGRPIFAIGNKNAASIKYIEDANIGVIAESSSQILSKVKELISDREALTLKGKRAWQLGRTNHSKKVVLEKFENDLSNISDKV